MKLCISLTHAAVLVITIAALPLFSINATAQIAVFSNDGKVVLNNGTVAVPANPVDDTVTIIDLGVSPPKVIAEFKAPSSVVGPPQNVAVAPDESFALVAATMKLDPADPTKQVPDNRLSVIDLKANPPAVIATLEAGLGPSGTAINPAGTLALVANLPGRDRLDIHDLRQDIDCGRQDRFRRSEIGAGRNIFHPRRQDGSSHPRRRSSHFHSVDRRSTVTDTKRIMTGGHRPYAVQVSPKGDIAVIGNQGANTGDVMPVNVVDLKGKAPRIVNTVDVGQYVEGLTFSNDGNYLAVIPQNGSNLAPTHPFYNDHGLLVVFSVNGTTLTKVAEVDIGQWPQGVAWSRDGKTLLAQSMVDNALAVLSFDGKSLKVTGQVKVTGGPDGIRTAGR